MSDLAAHLGGAELSPDLAPPEDLALYRADMALDVGTAYIRNQMKQTRTNATRSRHL
jgi:hypothetical protein